MEKISIIGGKMVIKILVTDGSNKNTLAVLRSLRSERYLTDLVNVYPRLFTLGSYSRYCNKTYRLKSTLSNIDDYAKELIDILKKETYDILIPVGLYSYLAVSKHRSEFEKCTRILVPDWDKMQIAYNKDLSMEFAKNLGIPIPETTVLHNEVDFNNIIKFPVVIKSSDDSGGFVKYCNNKRELEGNFRILKKSSKTNIISQEYITGFGCGFYGVYFDGELIAHFLHKRIKEFPITGGSSAVAESYFDDRLFNYGKILCDSLKWNGPIMVEFKYDTEEDDYKLIEINPKLWGSLDLTIESGVNVPEILVNKALNKNINHINTYKYIKYRWLFPDEFKVLMSHFSIRSLCDFLKMDQNTRTNFYWIDPLPFVFQLIYSLVYSMSMTFNNSKKFPHGKLK